MTNRQDTGGLAAAPGLGAAMGFALLSAFAFSTSGPFASGLIEAGWSPLAAVLARVAGAAILMSGPAALLLRGRGRLLRRHAKLIAGYGLLGVAGIQLAFFNAVQHLSVGAALLLEFLAPVLLVGWIWARTGTRPRNAVLGGSVTALAGLVLVLDIPGNGPLSWVGVVWGLLAALGLASYFVLAAHQMDGLPPVVTAAGGLTVGALALAAAALGGLLPVATSAQLVSLGGLWWPWWAPTAGLIAVSTALAYGSGVAATRRLGTRTASFVGLTEVPFAVVLARILLGEHLDAVQLLGGALILVGVMMVRADTPRALDSARRRTSWADQGAGGAAPIAPGQDCR